MNTDNDYDNDGNNIVPCPICDSAYCPSKEKGKCPEEDDFVRAVEAKNKHMTNKEELRDSIKDIETAKLFHDTYERLAPNYGYETREDTKEFDPLSDNGRLMIETCRLVVEQVRRERDEEMVELLNNCKLPQNSTTNGMTTCMYIPNETINIEVNNRIEWIKKQIIKHQDETKI